jgi:hypothetical protein
VGLLPEKFQKSARLPPLPDRGLAVYEQSARLGTGHNDAASASFDEIPAARNAQLPRFDERFKGTGSSGLMRGVSAESTNNGRRAP